MNSAKKPNILIVDDAPEMLIYLKILLKEVNADVIDASSGMEALEKCKNIDLALAIVDVQMPEMNGYTLALKINESRAGKIVPIIFLTAVYQDNIEIMKGYESGAVDYIFKPVNKSILISKVNVFLELFKQKFQPPRHLRVLKKIDDELTQSDSELIDSEIKFRSFLENAPDGIFILDESGNFLEVNDAFTTITGYSSNELLNMSLKDIVPENFKELLTNHEKKFFNSGSAHTEIVITHKNGKLHWCTIDTVQLSPKRFLTFSKDITYNKNAAEALMKSEEKYRTLLNASPEGIIIIDMNGLITDVSEIGLEMYGTDTPVDLIGKHFFRFLPQNMKETVVDIHRKTVEEGIVQNIEVSLHNKNLQPFIAEMSTTLIQGKDGSSISYMIVLNDITHRKKMERQLIHNDRMTTLGEMASGIAHEINQPLNTLSLVFDNILFETSKIGSLNKEYLDKKTDRIYENISRIKNIIDHIRAFSRSQDDNINSMFDINESIKNAISMVSEQIRHNNINLQFNSNVENSSIYGNTFKFEQVILNLIINAKDALIEKQMKFNDSYEKIININCYQKKYLCIDISDNGIGIDAELLDQIMLPFFTTKEAGKGTGLGLSITFGIIKEMKGTLSIKSELLKGTTITIQLPTETSIN